MPRATSRYGDVAVLFKPELYALLVSLKTDKINAQSALTTVLLPAYTGRRWRVRLRRPRASSRRRRCAARRAATVAAAAAPGRRVGGRRGRVAAGGALGGVAVRTVRAGRTPSGCAAAAADGSRGVISC